MFCGNNKQERKIRSRLIFLIFYNTVFNYFFHQTVYFAPVAHAVTVKVLSPVSVDDLILTISGDGRGTSDVGPVKPQPDPNGGFAFEHTMYMADVSGVFVKFSTLFCIFCHEISTRSFTGYWQEDSVKF